MLHNIAAEKSLFLNSCDKFHTKCSWKHWTYSWIYALSLHVHHYQYSSWSLSSVLAKQPKRQQQTPSFEGCNSRWWGYDYGTQVWLCCLMNEVLRACINSFVFSYAEMYENLQHLFTQKCFLARGYTCTVQYMHLYIRWTTVYLFVQWYILIRPSTKFQGESKHDLVSLIRTQIHVIERSKRFTQLRTFHF